MLLVGLTGNIASGKSTVAHLLAARGATIIDADVLARQAVEEGTPVGSLKVWIGDTLSQETPLFAAESVGVEHVFVGGHEIVTNSVLTGALPGTVLRAGKDTDTITVADRSLQPGSTK